jgi:transcriptional regulator with XRE-family HTH domain
MDPATLNRLEQGKGNPNIKTLEKLAAALSVRVSELLEEEVPKGPAPPSLDNGEERGHYPYPWMGDTLARTIDGWVKQTEVPPENPMFSYAISVGAIDVLQEVLRYDIPGETLRDRVPEDELGERIQLAKKLDRVLRRANEHYAANKDADSAEVRELFDAEADLRRRTKEIA